MDVTFLGSVTDHPGPFATVCADVTHVTENADTELDLRVRALADRLTEQGAPEAVVEAVRARLLEGNEGGEAGTYRGRAVVAGPDGTVLFDAPLADGLCEDVQLDPPQDGRPGSTKDLDDGRRTFVAGPGDGNVPHDVDEGVSDVVEAVILLMV